MNFNPEQPNNGLPLLPPSQTSVSPVTPNQAILINSIPILEALGR